MISKPRNRAFLVIAQTTQRSKDFLDTSLNEMKELTESALVKIVGSAAFNLPRPSPSHFVREGKLTEIRDAAQAAGANVLFFNVELSAGQARNIEAFTKIPAVDRTGLILDIFARRAQSSEGKLQVELARLNYALPRLGGLGVVLSRMGGGIGTRGPGEQMLDTDRRKIRKRIEQVKTELEKVSNHRELLRKSRRKKHFITAALVGYTNAGKSTLFNALTGADAYVEDKLFATLDPKTRMQSINGRRDVLFIDTVGFLRDLPHSLIEAFQATLEEVSEADLLIHVLDASNPRAAEEKKAVEEVLEEIKAGGKPMILALNKADLLNPEDRSAAAALWPEGILISARERLGMNSLFAKFEEVAEGLNV